MKSTKPTAVNPKWNNKPVVGQLTECQYRSLIENATLEGANHLRLQQLGELFSNIHLRHSTGRMQAEMETFANKLELTQQTPLSPHWCSTIDLLHAAPSQSEGLACLLILHSILRLDILLSETLSLAQELKHLTSELGIEDNLVRIFDREEGLAYRIEGAGNLAGALENFQTNPGTEPEVLNMLLDSLTHLYHQGEWLYPYPSASPTP